MHGPRAERPALGQSGLPALPLWLLLPSRQGIPVGGTCGPLAAGRVKGGRKGVR